MTSIDAYAFDWLVVLVIGWISYVKVLIRDNIQTIFQLLGMLIAITIIVAIIEVMESVNFAKKNVRFSFPAKRYLFCNMIC